MTDCKSKPQNLKPLYLLADSQLLFLKEKEEPYIRHLLNHFAPGQTIKAAYIGASNGDISDYYQMFEMAMNSIGIIDCLHIDAKLSQQHLSFLSNANIILLAGGDVWLGWQTISKIMPVIDNAREQGAILIGTSAGAVQMGVLGYREKPQLSNTDLFSTLGYVPAIFSPHQEKDNWKTLKQMVEQTQGTLPAIGIPTGAGLIVTPDKLVQAIRKPASILSIKEQQLIQQNAWKIQL